MILQGPTPRKGRPPKLDLVVIWPKYDIPDTSFGLEDRRNAYQQGRFWLALPMMAHPSLFFYGIRQFVEYHWIYLTRPSTVVPGIPCSQFGCGA